ncbi:hypothetical protein PtA15_2A45 [Puccinia triticina]|uniref:Uncharacterized protein n=1 Tax=Puccinia triticina TaxID=208348 RepID=A0ABY7C9A7_9BASI|nr:uncharacterized protein PtA15_2A45 [Puccinia triticina]WAQ81734.1 hypothetical protein PtA15_2A45 [Puccinia triticina]WAR52621.1 hypothetical protein PtB15_2B45 [Puccinia triticina]
MARGELPSPSCRAGNMAPSLSNPVQPGLVLAASTHPLGPGMLPPSAHREIKKLRRTDTAYGAQTQSPGLVNKLITITSASYHASIKAWASACPACPSIGPLEQNNLGLRAWKSA